jgi:hypothetical protein
MDYDNFKIVLNAASYKPTESAKIEKTADGYYRVRLGAFNVFNSSKAFYTYKGVQELVNNPNSFFWRRLKKGYLLGEMDHPKFKPGMTMPEFINRNAGYDMSNIAFHIKDVQFKLTNDKVNMMGNHGNVVIVEGLIKPSGPKGVFLEEALNNPDRNVAFSVRSLSKDEVVNGILVKHTSAILTWDWVTEPGINNANTFDMLNEKNINTESVSNLLTLEIKESDINTMSVDTGVNQESADLIEIRDTLRRQFSKKPVNRVLNW